MKFKDKCALITGSSRGIGRGIALKLAEQGVKVAVHYYKNAKAADETLVEIKERGSSGFIVQADILQVEQIQRMLKQVQEKFGKLDIFVSNARPELPDFFQPPLEITVENWLKALNSQATAFLVAVQQVVRFMPDNSRIIAMTYAPGSRTGSLQPWVGMGSAKAALESLVRYFAVSLAQRGITVNAISPGWIEDSVLNSLPDEVQNLIRNWHTRGWTPMRRLGTPADIGNVVTLMCSDEAKLITGQVLYADGGSSLMNPEVPTEIQIG